MRYIAFNLGSGGVFSIAEFSFMLIVGRTMKVLLKGDQERLDSETDLKNAVQSFHQCITNASARLLFETYNVIKRIPL
jgi:hypothetical protein